MAKTLQDLGQIALHAARSAGADAADVLVIKGSSVMIDVREGALEQAERSEGQDMGLRVFVGQRQAVVSSSDTRPEAVRAMAERAVAMASEAPDDPYVGLADPEQLTTDASVEALELNDPTPEPEPDALTNDALSAAAAAMAIKGITQIDGATAGFDRTQVHLAATNGFDAGYTRSSRFISCVAIAGTGTGMERDYDADSRTFQSDLRRADEIGLRAGERTIQRLGARKPPTGTYPVIYDERVSSTLIGHLLAAANGASIARGGSWLQDALGKAVLPAGLSLIEDPHRPRISGSRPFDVEGLPTKRRAIVEDGVLTGWTLDLATGRKLGMTSTGNATRGASSGPSPANGNAALTQGAQTRADLIGGIKEGLLITSMIGSTINPTTGDYSRGAAGFWIENGELTYAVNECTVAGNLRDMLLRIVPANDARAHLSRVVPSILIDGMAIAGN